MEMYQAVGLVRNINFSDNTQVWRMNNIHDNRADLMQLLKASYSVHCFLKYLGATAIEQFCHVYTSLERFNGDRIECHVPIYYMQIG